MKIRTTSTVHRKKTLAKLKANTRPMSQRVIEEDINEGDEEEYYATAEPNMKLSHAFIVVLILHIIAVGGILGFNNINKRQAAMEKVAAEAAASTQTNALAEANKTTPAGSTRNAQASKNGNSQPSKANTAANSYEIQPGDTLAKIATQRNITVEALEKANGITSKSFLRAGQILTIPAAESAAVNKVASAPVTKTPAITKAPEPVKAPPVNKPTVDTKTPIAPKTAATPPAKSATPPTTPVAKTTTPAPTGESPTIYEVAKGDNPYSIAKKHHISYQTLIEFNGITDPTKIQIGQKLKIPTK